MHAISVLADMNAVVLLTASGYSTDRAEKYYTADQPSTSNTLTLPDRRKQPAYTGQDGDGSTSPVPMAGFDEDVCLVTLSTLGNCVF